MSFFFMFHFFPFSSSLTSVFQAALSANMSNLAWLNAGKQSPPSSVMDQMDVKHMSKMDKHPLGGIK